MWQKKRKKKSARLGVKPWSSNAYPVTDTEDKENASSVHFKMIQFCK